MKIDLSPWLQKAETLALENPLVQEAMYWIFLMSLAKFSIGVVLIIFAAFLAMRISTNIPSWVEEDAAYKFWLSVATFFALGVTGFSMTILNVDWIQIKTAPKTWLVENAKELYKDIYATP